MSARQQMYALLVRKSILGRGSRVLTALAAVTLAATVTTALGNLQVSLKGKLSGELAAFGPNLLISCGPHAPLRLASLQTAAKQLSLKIDPYLNVQLQLIGSRPT